MADEVRNVIIDKIEWSPQLPKWATEDLQKKLLAAQGILVDIEKSKVKKVGTQHTALLKQIGDTTTLQEKGFKSMIRASKDASAKFSKFSAEKLIPKTPFKAFNSGIGKFASKLGVVGAALGALGFVVGGVVGRFKAFSDSFRTLFTLGFRFEQGAMGVAKAAVRAEMGIDQYTEILGRFSTTIGVLGTTAFSDLNVAMRKNLMEVGLLGMNLGELTEHTADYLEQRQLLGILEGDQVRNLTAQTETYLKNISAMSTLFNVSRDQITQIIKSSVTIQAFTNALNRMPDNIQENMLEVAQTITGGFAGIGLDYANQLANTFTTAIGRGGLYFTEAGRELLAVNQPLYHAMASLADVTDPSVAGPKFANMLDMLKNTTDAERERLMILERSNTQYANGARNMITLVNRVQQLDEATIDSIKSLEKFRDAQRPDEVTKAFTHFEIAMARVRVVWDQFFTALFGNNRILKTFEVVMNKMATISIKVADYLKENAEKWGLGIASGIEKFLDWVKKLKSMSWIQMLGTLISKALIGPFILLGKVLGSAITRAVKMAMPGMPFFKDMKEAEKNRLQSVQSGSDIQKMIDSGEYDASKISDTGISRSYLGFKGEKTKGKPWLDDNLLRVWTEDMSDVNKAALAKIVGDGGDYFKSISGEGFEEQGNNMIRKVLADVKGNKELEKIMYQNLLKLNQKIAKYEESEVARMSGTKTWKKSDIESMTAGGDGKSPLSDLQSPEQITSAKMRIMRQYLPMTGKEDPNADPNKNFYETVILKLEAQISALVDINRTANTIVKNTG